jgi:hypothetical protein
MSVNLSRRLEKLEATHKQILRCAWTYPSPDAAVSYRKTVILSRFLAAEIFPSRWSSPSRSGFRSTQLASLTALRKVSPHR